MIQKTYRGPSFSELLNRARTELGDGATVISSGRVPEAPNLHEIVVAVADPSAWMEPPAATPARAPAPTRAESALGLRLRSLGADQTLVDDLLAVARARPRAPERAVQERIARIVRGGGAEQRAEVPRVIVLAGPMGGGKTTTAAKLAAWYRSHGDGAPVLATLDSFRAGAVAQLRSLAELVGAPFHVVAEARDLVPLVRSIRHARPLIVDTPGLVLSQEASREALRSWTAPLPEQALHLVLPASAHPDYLSRIVAQAADVGPAGLIVTKLDEHQAPGLIVSACARLRVPLTWSCAGPRIPSDLDPPSPEAIARRLAPTPGPGTPLRASA